MTILYLLTALNSLAQEYPLLFLLFDLTLKCSIILLMAFVVKLQFHKRAASDKSALWIVAMSALLLLPLFYNLVPTLPVALSIHETGFASLILLQLNEVAATINSRGFDLSEITTGIVYGYAVVSLFLGLYLALGFLRVILVTRNATPLPSSNIKNILRQLQLANGNSCRVELLQSACCISPVTWGIKSHKILLPCSINSWNDSLITQVLSHELAHIQRKDWLCYMISRTAVCLYWINPLVWLAHNNLIMESEKACDDAAISDTGCSVSYAENLFQLAGSMHSMSREMPRSFAATALLGKRSALAQRIRYILSNKKDSSHGDRSCVISGLLVSVLLVAPFSALSPSIQIVESKPVNSIAIPVNFIAKDSVEYGQYLREFGGD